MSPQTRCENDIAAESARRRAQGLPYVMATVVRTMAATSAKPGAKALIDAEGQIVVGFLGGGCVRGAVGRAAREAIAEGAPQLLSIRPEELLSAEGLAPGETRDGIHYARNGCPSKGALDIFIEPVLPRSRLVICGSGPVAQALAALSERFDFDRTLCLPSAQEGELPAVDRIVEHLDDDPAWHGTPFVVIATQGRGDEAALRRALASNARHIAFVGSSRKFAALSARLSGDIAPKALAKVQAPAGLDINAITPDEIALSILADLTKRRRASQRSG
ncbi:XdhC family protein [Tropicibacter oceani]|uniref:XdhC family protein n=1 Tax=Tropicibacter oceani TaxID=3058420 RepID=A0ABY8QCK9_9RHOB|nr:XdhC family protein [Tropicibacter oceani]WGW02362.1 XdhC family protein [Tropicibacter oceani]